jgi:mono/diheme cytochrome c family protein
MPNRGRLCPALSFPMRQRVIAIVVVLIVILGLAVTLGLSFNLSALPDPGATETAMAIRAKKFLIARASRNEIPPEPANSLASVAEGRKRFGTECSMCHGLNGRTATDAGRWMYPRAADLGSDQVQQYSDRELFWIIKNGIRLSGMPAFGKVETDERIWDLVHYTRTFRPSPASR